MAILTVDNSEAAQDPFEGNTGNKAPSNISGFIIRNTQADVRDFRNSIIEDEHRRSVAPEGIRGLAS